MRRVCSLEFSLLRPAFLIRTQLASGFLTPLGAALCIPRPAFSARAQVERDAEQNLKRFRELAISSRRRKCAFYASCLRQNSFRPRPSRMPDANHPAVPHTQGRQPT